ncbi:MFS transporter [Siminovitchia sediminis]|uniref:MFS transporter n=1 Tax=Siminovitchia sediminis TaxID=1274353 RepID=A0ABW4KJT5_9BACI
MNPDQKRKLIILMINMFIAIGSFGIIIPILPAYLVSIGQGGTAAGLMIAIFAAAQFIISPIAGKWTDQYGRRKMIIYGLSGLALSMLIFYFSHSIWILYFSRVIGGIGAALLIPAIFAYVADITTLEQRAKGNSYISAAMSLGIVIGPGIGGFLAEYGLKMPLLVSALVGIGAVIFSIAILKESRDVELTASNHTEDPMIKKLLESVHKPYFIPLIIVLVMSFGLMAYESIIGLYLDNAFKATPQQIAVMITISGIISVVVQIFAVDRLVSLFGEGKVLNIFIVVVAGGFLFSMFAVNYVLFFIITLIIFMATSILRPVLNTLISKMAGNEQGFAMGMNNAYMSIGNVLGPLIAGMIYDIHMIFPFLLGFLMLIFTGVVSVTWQKKKLTNKTAPQ